MEGVCTVRCVCRSWRWRESVLCDVFVGARDGGSLYCVMCL